MAIFVLHAGGSSHDHLWSVVPLMKPDCLSMTNLFSDCVAQLLWLPALRPVAAAESLVLGNQGRDGRRIFHGMGRSD